MKIKTLFTAFLTSVIRNVLLSHRYKKKKIEKATWFGKKSVTQPLRQLLSKDLSLTAANMSTFYYKLRGIYFVEIQTQSKILLLGKNFSDWGNNPTRNHIQVFTLKSSQKNHNNYYTGLWQTAIAIFNREVVCEDNHKWKMG